MMKKLFVLIAILLIADIIVSVYAPHSNAVPMILGGIFIVYVIMRKNTIKRFILRAIGSNERKI